MPRNVMHSLEYLSIYSVSKNWDELVANSVRRGYENISVIKHLPEPLLEEIKKRLLRSFYKPLTFQDLHLFTCRPISILNLKQYSIPKFKISQTIQHLLPRLTTLKSLTISSEFVQAGTIPSNKYDIIEKLHLPDEVIIFNCFLQSLPNITYLNLEETPIQDWMLSTISKYCIHLHELNISYCKELTDVGIMALVEDTPMILEDFSDSTSEKCLVSIRQNQPLLYLQKIWLLATSITQDSIIQLLVHYPSLKTFYHQEFLIAFTFLHTTNNNEMPFDHQQLPVALLKDLVCNKESLRLLNDLTVLWNHIWSLKLIELRSNTDLSFLSGLQNLQELQLSNDRSDEKCGLNLSVIANNCPNLKTLILNVNGHLKFNQSIPQSAFHLLNSLTINGMKADSLLVSDAFKLLSRCRSLQLLHLNQCPWLSDKILEDIIRLNPLHRIQHMTLFKTKLSVDGIRKLLDMKNNLNILSISSFLLCIKHRHYFENYIRFKNWDLIFKLYPA